MQNTKFQCQPPSVVQAPSKNYPFSIEAVSNNGYPTSAEGNVEVLPVGFIDFTTTQNTLQFLVNHRGCLTGSLIQLPLNYYLKTLAISTKK